MGGYRQGDSRSSRGSTPRPSADTLRQWAEAAGLAVVSIHGASTPFQVLVGEVEGVMGSDHPALIPFIAERLVERVRERINTKAPHEIIFIAEGRPWWAYTAAQRAEAAYAVLKDSALLDHLDNGLD